MTGGGIEPTTTGLKAPYRIPFDYPAEINATLYFTKQLPHRVLH